MAVSVLRSAESHTGTTGSPVGETSFSFSLGQSGDVPRGVIVFVFQVGAGTHPSNITTGVTYGGSSLESVSTAVDTAGEPGRVTAWLLRSSVPTGAATVVVNRLSTTSTMYAVGYTVGGSGDISVAGTPYLYQENAAYGGVSYNDGLTFIDRSIVFGGAYFGGNTPALAYTSGGTFAVTHNIDFGAYGCSAGYETSPAYGARMTGFYTATADDRAGILLGLTDKQPAITMSGVSVLTSNPTASASVYEDFIVEAPDSTLTGALAAEAIIYENFIATSEVTLSNVIDNARAEFLRTLPITAASTLTGGISVATSVSQNFTVQGDSDVSLHKLGHIITATSTLTGAISAATTAQGYTYIESAAVLTGGLASDANVVQGITDTITAASTLSLHKLAHLMSAASTLTGVLTAESGAGSTQVTITSDAELSLHPYAYYVAASSTLTGSLSSYTLIGQFEREISSDVTITPALSAFTNVSNSTGGGIGILAASTLSLHPIAPQDIRAASTLTENASHSVEVTAASSLTGVSLISLVSIRHQPDLSAASTLTGTLTHLAAMIRTIVATTMTAESTLSGPVSGAALLPQGYGVTGGSTLTGAISSTAQAWDTEEGDIRVYHGDSTLPYVTSASSIVSTSSLVSSPTIFPVLISYCILEKYIPPGYAEQSTVLTNSVSGDAIIRIRVKMKSTHLHGSIVQPTDTTLRVIQRGGSIWPSN